MTQHAPQRYGVDLGAMTTIEGQGCQVTDVQPGKT
jgi:hypothetical protein